MSDVVLVCPNCDSTQIGRRSRAQLSERWRCRDCGGSFRDPVERERRRRDGRGTGRRGLAGQLAELDSEVSDA